MLHIGCLCNADPLLCLPWTPFSLEITLSLAQNTDEISPSVSSNTSIKMEEDCFESPSAKSSALDKEQLTLRQAAILGDVDKMPPEGSEYSCMDWQDTNGRTPLHWAVVGNSEESIKRILSMVGVKALRDRGGFTPLHEAIVRGRRAAAKALVECTPIQDTIKPNLVNVTDKKNLTPLYWATKRRDRELVELLLGHGARLNALGPNGDGIEVLRLIMNGKRDETFFTFFIQLFKTNQCEDLPQVFKNNADLKSDASTDDDSLSSDCKNLQRRLLDMALDTDNCEMTPALSECGVVNLDARAADGETILTHAIGNCDNPMCKYLINELKVNVNKANSDGITPLMAAAILGDIGITELLVDKNATVNTITRRAGATALMFSAIHASGAVMDTLITKGSADTEIPDIENRRTVLFQAVASRNQGVVERLLKHEANPNATDKDKNTMLILAAQCRDRGIAVLLLNHGARRDDIGAEGRTALMAAAMRGYDDMVSLLLEYGANIEAKDSESNTACIIAAMQGHESVVKVLLAAGADVKAENNTGYSALRLAHKRSLVNIVKLLEGV